MKNNEKFTVFLAVVGLLASLMSFAFITLEEKLFSGLLKEFSTGLIGAIVGVGVAFISLLFISKKEGPSIFISYLSQDKEIARRVANELRGISSHVWFDEREILVGDNVKEKIESGLKNSKYFVILMPSEGGNSSWMTVEYNKAKSMCMIILPVKIDDSDTPEALKNIAYADLTSSFEDGMEKIKKTLADSSHKKSVNVSE